MGKSGGDKGQGKGRQHRGKRKILSEIDLNTIKPSTRYLGSRVNVNATLVPSRETRRQTIYVVMTFSHTYDSLLKADESSCTRCLRSSPLGALLLMILVFLGATAFGVGTIFGRKRLYELLEVDHL
ncbi:unnamed protein product [Rodentolepis nana]|uniref:Conserved plasma membrane protein n=1 Tax=Rodentolepis nana TaxID=102285 RepID=A0A0R3TES9_RODNA|nr:unnamed protein product [Rodentolepis nana]